MATDIVLTKDAIVPNTKHITQLLQFLSEYNDISHFQSHPSAALFRKQHLKFSSHNIAAQASSDMLKSRENRIKRRESELEDHERDIHDREQELSEKQRSVLEREQKCNHKMALMESDEETLERRRRHQQQQLALIVQQSHMNTARELELKQREEQLLNRERQQLYRQSALSQREKNLIQREHALDLRLKLKGGE